MICHNGDHFFALVNYEKFWINFDSLSNSGPEFLVFNELTQLILDQANKGGMCFTLAGEFPKKYRKLGSLEKHQKIFTLNEVFEQSSLIKAMRESQHEAVQKKIQENYLKKDAEAVNQALKLSKLSAESLNEEELLKIAIEESIKPENCYSAEEMVKLRIRKLNGHFVTNFFKKTEKVSDLFQWVTEAIGCANIKLYHQLPQKIYLTNKDLLLSSMIQDPSKNLIFLEDYSTFH